MKLLIGCFQGLPESSWSFWALHVDLGAASQGWTIMRLNPIQWNICQNTRYIALTTLGCCFWTSFCFCLEQVWLHVQVGSSRGDYNSWAALCWLRRALGGPWYTRWCDLGSPLPSRKECSKNVAFWVIASGSEESFQYEQKRDKQPGSEITLEFGFGGELGWEVLTESPRC